MIGKKLHIPNFGKSQQETVYLFINFDIGFNLGYLPDFLMENFSSVVLYKIYFKDIPHEGESLIEFIKNKKIHAQSKPIFFKTSFPPITIFSYFTYFFNLLKLKMRFYPQRIIAISPNPYFVLFSIILRMRSVYIVGDIMRVDNSNSVTHFFSLITRGVIYRVMERAYLVWFISDSLERYFKKVKTKQSLVQTMAIRSAGRKVNSKNKEKKILYIGNFDKSKGIELIQRVAKKKNKYNFLLIGSEKDLALPKNVQIRKPIVEERKILELLKNDSYIALAPYIPENGSSYLGDPTKIKQYLRYNIPTITTDTIEFSQILEKYHAGVKIEYDPDQLQQAIEEIDKDYDTYLEGVSQLVNDYEVNKYYLNIFARNHLI